MTPLVQKAVEQQFCSNMVMFRDRPEDFTWFDIDEATKQQYGVPTTAERIEALTLPFERTAFVTQDEEGIPIIVYTKQSAVDATVLAAITAGISVPKRKRLIVCEMSLHQSTGCYANEMHIRVADAKYPGVDVGREVTHDTIKLIWLALRAYQNTVKAQVGSRYVGASSNKRRAKEGRKPLFEWRTVVIEPKALPNPPKGGTHASPRHHDRRGHWSVSKLGKRYWRRATKVGNPANGIVFHDYQLKPNRRN